MPTLLFSVTEDWYFLAHRLALARAARDAGFRVGVATRVNGDPAAILDHGFALHSVDWRRGALDPRRVAGEVRALRRLYGEVRPDIVHHVSLRPILAGSWAALAAGVPARLDAVTGLGTLFSDDAPRHRLARRIVLGSLRLTQKRGHSITLVENEHDREALERALRLGPDRIVRNPGSGRDLLHFRPLPLPDNDVPVIACAARLLRIKGVADLVAASVLANANGTRHRLVIAGPIDHDSANAIPEAEVRNWAARGVEWLGPIADVRALWKEADVAALASHGGEGVPLSLVEAAACGRPLLSTDAPGNADIARAGVNALLAPPRDVKALAATIARMIADAPLRRRFAEASPAVAAEFSDAVVIPRTLALYERLLAGS